MKKRSFGYLLHRLVSSSTEFLKKIDLFQSVFNDQTHWIEFLLDFWFFRSDHRKWKWKWNQLSIVKTDSKDFFMSDLKAIMIFNKDQNKSHFLLSLLCFDWTKNSFWWIFRDIWQRFENLSSFDWFLMLNRSLEWIFQWRIYWTFEWENSFIIGDEKNMDKSFISLFNINIGWCPSMLIAHCWMILDLSILWFSPFHLQNIAKSFRWQFDIKFFISKRLSSIIIGVIFSFVFLIRNDLFLSKWVKK